LEPGQALADRRLLAGQALLRAAKLPERWAWAVTERQARLQVRRAELAEFARQMAKPAGPPAWPQLRYLR